MQIDPRYAELKEWINDTLGITDYELTTVSGDASFRRYFRLVSDKHNYIAVDAPPDKENNKIFTDVTHLLEAEGLPVPHIFYCALNFGYFLLSDFGDTLFLNILNDNNADELYAKAFDALLIIQKTSAVSLPPYDYSLLHQEMELFREWYLGKNLTLKLTEDENKNLTSVFEKLTDNALQQPQVFVHRDYHSRNLMHIDNAYPGIIDYQDAVCGPVTYDLVSLLRDCYIQWPEEKIQNWVQNYFQQIITRNIIDNIDFEIFSKWFDLMGIQRHLKAIGIFSRLNFRDSKPNYLQDIPRTLSYIRNIAPKYPETQNLAQFIKKRIPS